MIFLGIGIIRTEKCWPNSPTYSTDVGVLRGWGRAQITVDILGREAKKVEKHCSKSSWIGGAVFMALCSYSVIREPVDLSQDSL